MIGRRGDSLIHTEAGHQGSPPPLSGSLDESDVVMWPARYEERRGRIVPSAAPTAWSLARAKCVAGPAKTWFAGRGRRVMRRPALRKGISP